MDPAPYADRSGHRAIQGEKLCDALRSEELKSYLLNQLTKTFKYQHNLTGQNAREYFGALHPAVFEISSVSVKGMAVLTAKSMT